MEKCELELRRRWLVCPWELTSCILPNMSPLKAVFLLFYVPFEWGNNNFSCESKKGCIRWINGYVCLSSNQQTML